MSKPFRKAPQSEMKDLCKAAAVLDRWPLMRCRTTLDALTLSIAEYGDPDAGERSFWVRNLNDLRDSAERGHLLFLRLLGHARPSQKKRIRQFFTVARLAAVLVRRAAPNSRPSPIVDPAPNSQQPPLI